MGMTKILSFLTNFTEHTVARLKVRSAINSMLWLTVTSGVLGLVGTLSTEPPIQYVMVGLMCIGPVFSALGFLYFTIRDPNKLRSEQYELRKTALSMIEEKGGSIPIDVTSVEAIANLTYSPKALKQIEDNDK